MYFCCCLFVFVFVCFVCLLFFFFFGGGGGGGMDGARRGTWGPDPPENHKNIGFLSNAGPETLKNHKSTKSIQCLAIISQLAKHHLNGVLLACR